MKITKNIKEDIKDYLNVKIERGERFQRALKIVENTNKYCFHKSSDYLFNTRINNDFRSQYEKCERFLHSYGGKYTYYSFLFYDKKEKGGK